MGHEMTLKRNRLGVLGKGGAGKSTTVVLLANDLHRHGYPVCVLDADATDCGLHHALGIDDPPKPLLDLFGGMVFSGGAVTCPVHDPMPLAGAELDLVKLEPDYYRRSPEGVYLLTAGKIGDKGPGAGCDGPISKIARDVRVRIGEVTPVTLVDFKAGFEDAARGVVTSLDLAIVVVDPSSAAIRMAIEMKKMVCQIKAGIQPATDHLGRPDQVEAANRVFRESTIKDVVALLNRIRGREVLDYLEAQLSHSGIVSVGMIPDDPAITISWLVGAPLATGAQAEMDVILDALKTLGAECVTPTTHLTGLDAIDGVPVLEIKPAATGHADM